MEGLILYFLPLLIFFSSTYIAASENYTWTISSAPTEYWAEIASDEAGIFMVAVSTGAKGRIWLSSNGGNSWTQSSAPAESWYSVTISSNGQYIVAGTGEDPSYIYYSADGGSNWYQSQAVPTINAWNAVSCSYTGEFCIAAAYDGSIYTSSNYGVSWTISNAPNNPWSSVKVSSTGAIGYATGGDAYTAVTGQIYKSTNYGSTWSVLQSSPTQAWSISCDSNGVNLVAASSTDIYYSSNGGTNWFPASAPSYLWLDTASDYSGQFVSAITSGYGVYLSSNYGVTWALSNANTNLNYAFITSNGNGTVLAVTVNGGSIIVGNIGGSGNPVSDPTNAPTYAPTVNCGLSPCPTSCEAGYGGSSWTVYYENTTCSFYCEDFPTYDQCSVDGSGCPSSCYPQLSAGDIAAIVICSVFGFCACCGGIWYLIFFKCCKKKEMSKQEENKGSELTTPTEF